MHRRGISFTSTTMVKILLIVLALAVLFGFIDWAVSGVSTLVGFIQWGPSGELSVDSYSIDPDANPPFHLTFTFTNTADSEMGVLITVKGSGGVELGKVPDQGLMSVAPRSAEQRSIEYSGDSGTVEEVGCRFTVTAKKKCEKWFNAPFRAAAGELPGVGYLCTVATTSVTIPKDRRPDAWGGECPSVKPDDGGGLLNGFLGFVTP
ncbi:MAG: hypothetical protein ABEI97_02385 [Candidatus Nanohaloarchaea archaeon]